VGHVVFVFHVAWGCEAVRFLGHNDCADLLCMVFTIVRLRVHFRGCSDFHLSLRRRADCECLPGKQKRLS
jgi:hypothetical protein